MFIIDLKIGGLAVCDNIVHTLTLRTPRADLYDECIMICVSGFMTYVPECHGRLSSKQLHALRMAKIKAILSNSASLHKKKTRSHSKISNEPNRRPHLFPGEMQSRHLICISTCRVLHDCAVIRQACTTLVFGQTENILLVGFRPFFKVPGERLAVAEWEFLWAFCQGDRKLRAQSSGYICI